MASSLSGASNYVNMLISSTCVSFPILLTVPTYTISPVPVSTTVVISTLLHGTIVASNPLCPITSYILQSSDGSPWTNDLLSVETVMVAGVKEPSLNILADSVFILSLRLFASTAFGVSNFLNFNVISDCSSTPILVTTAQHLYVGPITI